VLHCVDMTAKQKLETLLFKLFCVHARVCVCACVCVCVCVRACVRVCVFTHEPNRVSITSKGFAQ